jgi:glycosyltransferase involved in cell wall biosynthesis
MKSICLVVQSIYDFDPRVRRKAEALAAAGFSVDVLALRPSPGKHSYSLNGVHVDTFSLGKQRGSLVRYAFEYAAFFLWVLFRLPWQMLRRRYSVIDINTLPDFLIFAAVLAKWMGAKLILDMHEITPEFYRSKYRIPERSLTVRILTYVEKISMAFADHVLTINHPIEDLLVGRGLPRSKSTVIMNAVDESRFAASATSFSSIAGERGASGFVMMYHGTLTSIYGLDIAVEAFALAEKEMPGSELWILGLGPEAGALKELARARGVGESVRFPGQVASTDIPAWLRQADMGILPIRHDVFLDFAFPNKLPEFIFMDKPVLISRLKAIQHYFSDDALAYCAPNDAADLAQQMVRMYRNPHQRAQLAVTSKQEYLPIRWDVMRQRYIGLVEQLVATNTEAVESTGRSTEIYGD